MFRRFSVKLSSQIRQNSTLAESNWKSYFRKRGYLHISLKNDKIAKQVVEKTKHSYLNDDKWVFEAAPGKGILTRELLKSHPKKVRIFEHKEEQHSHLNILKQEFPDSLEIVDSQIIGLFSF